MFGYPVQTASDYELHTVKNVDRYIDAACWWYQQQGLCPAVSKFGDVPLRMLMVTGS